MTRYSHAPDLAEAPRVWWRRMRLRRADGAVYLDRWGIECRSVGIFLHRMAAPDPGLDLHDHPWDFWSLILWGGYFEERCAVACACMWARLAEGDGLSRGYTFERLPLSVKALRMSKCHRITQLRRRTCWTVIVHGPRRTDRADQRSVWGFYTPTGWVDELTYDETVRAERRDLWNEEMA